MALFSVFTIIRAISLFHITLAYFFLTAPRMIADQNMVYVLGEALRLVCLTRHLQLLPTSANTPL